MPLPPFGGLRFFFCIFVPDLCPFTPHQTSFPSMRFVILVYLLFGLGSSAWSQKTDFAVEVGAFAERVPLSYFKIGGVYETYDQNQIYRYHIDAADRSAAETLRQNAIAAGHKYARVLDFQAMRAACDAACGYTPPSRTGNLTSAGKQPEGLTGSPRTANSGNPAPTEPGGQPLRITGPDLYAYWAKELRRMGIGMDSAQLYRFWKKEQGRIGLDSTAWMQLWEKEFRRPANPTEPGYSVGLTDETQVRCIFFDFNSHALREESKNELEKLFDILRKNPGFRVEVRAHTDSRGSVEYNRRLSLRRAGSARKYLIARGLSSSRVTTHYYGKSEPIARNEFADGTDCPDGRQLNRRVEFVVFDGQSGRVDVVLRIDVPENLRY